jgi:CheY-like chemotaxis protein
MNRTTQSKIKHNPASCPVLVVDDEAPIREFVSRALGANGYPVTTAASAAAALAELSEKNFALLISDIVMPEMDGIALALKITRDYPQMKIILISGYVLERQRAYNIEALIQRVMPKPFSLQELVEAVTQVLDS